MLLITYVCLAGQMALRDGEGVVLFEIRAWPDTRDKSRFADIEWCVRMGFSDIDPSAADQLFPMFDFVVYTSLSRCFRIHPRRDGACEYMEITTILDDPDGVDDPEI